MVLERIALKVSLVTLESIMGHPRYSPKEEDSDIAKIELKLALSLSDTFLVT